MPYKNKEDRVKNSAEYYEKNRDRIRSYIRVWQSKNPEKIRVYARKANARATLLGKQNEYYHKNSCRIREQQKTWRARFPERSKNQELRKRYGITLDDYNEKLRSQEGRCASCYLEFDMKDCRNKPQVDHCHETGAFRGILCRTCNIVQGFLCKRAETIDHVLEYLKKHETEGFQ